MRVSLVELFKNSKNKIELFPFNSEKTAHERLLFERYQDNALLELLGLTSGIHAMDGWLRVLSSGSFEFERNISTWNTSKFNNDAVLVADDVIGGYFAINYGAFGNDMGTMYYFAPDTLEWESMDLDFYEFLEWICNGDTYSFYGDDIWNGWNYTGGHLSVNDAILIYPFLWSTEGQSENVTRKKVPVQELWDLQMDMKNQLDG